MIENTATGERIRIVTSGEETAGELLAFELHLEPQGHVPAPHLHPGQQESFRVLDGQFRLRIGARVLLLARGEAASVPAGRPHSFSNPGPGPALVRVEVRPALRMAELLEAAALLGDRPRLLALARFLSQFRAEVGAPLMPGTIGRLALLAARLGGEPRVP